VEARLKVEYIEIVEYLSDGGSFEVESGTSSARPNKMVEGGNGPSHCPFPRWRYDPTKIYKTEYEPKVSFYEAKY